MFCLLTLLSFILVVTEAQQLRGCKNCDAAKFAPVCGNDGVTYSSYCSLTREECLTAKEIGFKCNGNCPCDPAEVENMDQDTVHKLQNLRAKFQLENHGKEESQDFLTLQILGEKDVKKHNNLEDIERNMLKHQELLLKSEKYYKKGSGKCPTEEMSELPSRLIDWFHVLKANEKEKEYKDEGIEKEPVLKEMNFIDAKLKSMYSELACEAQDDTDIEKQVCLTPVQWMFHHLDGNKDSSLSASELYEIEQINNEHCIKPFLRDCDSNGDGKVVLKEFCKCLCLTPPCIRAIQAIPTVLLRGELRPMPGFFTHKCDEDGFFMPTQCSEKQKECWCVDRNGAELEGTRVNGKANCNLNTKSIDKKIKLIPLDMNKENEPIAKRSH